MTTSTLLKKPSAFVPVLMSCAALALVLGTVAVFGVVHEEDEGTAAHVWQLLMGGQVPIIVFFMFTWVPRATRPALAVLVLQAVAAVAAMLPVFLLGL